MCGEYWPILSYHAGSRATDLTSQDIKTRERKDLTTDSVNDSNDEALFNDNEKHNP